MAENSQLNKSEAQYYVAFTKDDRIRTMHNFDKDYIKAHSYKLVYTKNKGLKKSLSPLEKLLTFSPQQGSQPATTNIVSAGVIVK